MPGPPDDSASLTSLGLASAELAHELRNVLATIAISAHAASRTPSEAPRFLERITRHAELGQRLVEDVLALAQLGAVTIGREDVATADVLAAARETMQLDATFVDDIELPKLSVHLGLFARLLHALYANATQAQRGARAQIVTRVFAEAGIPCLEIQDNGPGIPPALRETLFQPFSTARPGGIGLGLALAQRIAEAHGGRLTLRDDRASTTLRIALPAP